MTKTRLHAARAAFLAAAIALSGTAAHAESPFHTGVWQVNEPTGPNGLVVSDWLVFENGLPKRWLYRRAGTNDQNQFDFLVRNIGESTYAPVQIRVYRTGDHEMKYTTFVKGAEPVEHPAKRLSIPNYKNSCLSVENKGERLFGTWAGTTAASFKRLRLSKTKLTIDGQTRNVEVAPVRVGRLGIVENGQPVAFLTDAGGDYAVLQWFKPGIDTATMGDPKKEILDFAREEIVRWPGGTCDRQIASRLKAMK
ncbi:hypothetical protein [Stappia indica]|jgi:hypothetical protein|uniref:Uncharacterized protein n=1 Tax=Stappia indica TaxID=538381 RepID=A0A857C7Y5_9HYPH|nr:hypothetical protein [Stappia indica]QGZ35007.1 hypothetical protein GH266_11110 [Stappia indica]